MKFQLLLITLFLYNTTWSQKISSDPSRTIKNYIGLGYFRANPKTVDRLANAGPYFNIGILGEFKAIVPQLDFNFGSGINLFDARYTQTQLSLLAGKKISILSKKFTLLPSIGISYYIQKQRDGSTDFENITTNGVGLPLSFKLFKAKEKAHLGGSFMANINSETVFFSTGLEFTF